GDSHEPGNPADNGGTKGRRPIDAQPDRGVAPANGGDRSPWRGRPARSCQSFGGESSGMTLHVTSTAFQQGETIPRLYTADGANHSRPLKWDEPPSGTRSLALIAEDPNAPHGTWSHWVVFNIPALSRELAEGVLAERALPNGMRQGVNDFKQIGYRGPAPPP